MDQAVASVTPGDTTKVTIEQRDELMLPVTVNVTFEDGSSEQRRIPSEAFFTKDTHTFTVTNSVSKVQVDPNQILPDVNPKNDTWTPSESGGGSSSSGDK